MALNVNDLMNELNSGSKWDTGVTFNRTNPVPIDKSSYFTHISAAENYALSGKTSYVGQQLFILNDTLSTADEYIIQDLSGTLQKVILSNDLNQFALISTVNELSDTLNETFYLHPYIVSSYKSGFNENQVVKFSCSFKMFAIDYINKLYIQTAELTGTDYTDELHKNDEFLVIGTTSLSRYSITDDNTYFKSSLITFPERGEIFSADIQWIKEYDPNIDRLNIFFYIPTANLYKAVRFKTINDSLYSPTPDFIYPLDSQYPILSVDNSTRYLTKIQSDERYFTKDQSDARYLQHIPDGISSYADIRSHLSNDGYVLSSITNELSSNLISTSYIVNQSPYIFNSYADGLSVSQGTYTSFQFKMQAFNGYTIQRIYIQTNARSNETLSAGDELSIIGTTATASGNISPDNTYFISKATTYPIPGNTLTADIIQVKDYSAVVNMPMYFYFSTSNGYQSARIRTIRAKDGSSYVPTPDFIHSSGGWYPQILVVNKATYLNQTQSDERYLQHIPDVLSSYNDTKSQLSNDGYATSSWVNEHKSKVTINNDSSPADLSVFKVTSDEYADIIHERDVLSNELYVIDDDEFVSVYGRQIKDVENGTLPTDAVNMQQLNAYKTQLVDMLSSAFLSAGITKQTSIDSISYGHAISCIYFLAQSIMQ